MTQDPSDWRSTVDYGYVEQLSASDLAWEWLRRNEAYGRDFKALTSADADVPLLTERIRQHWRLFYPARPRDCIP